MTSVFLITSDAEETADHSKFHQLQKDFANAQDVTKTCLECHTEAGHQIQNTIHWTWEYVTKSNRNVGKAWVLNNFCVAVPSNEPRCTSCHVGYGWANKNFDFKSQTNIDCLVCHEQTGTYKKFPTAAGHPVYEEKLFQGKKKFLPPDFNEVAQSVAKPKNYNCGVCHFYGGGGNGVKHGDLDNSLLTASNDLDVHIGGEGMQCIDCHEAHKHFVPGTKYEYSDKVKRPTCTESGCHTMTPHTSSKINDHTNVVSCQTCHIPEFARGGVETKMWWDWSKAGDKTRKNTKNYNVKKGEFRWAKNVEPEYRWHNGSFKKYLLATDKIDPTKAPITINELAGMPKEEGSMIYPFKVHAGKQIYDTKENTLIIPRLFGTGEQGAYWKLFDWDKAARSGMEYSGLPYSGEFDFVETKMYWPITHMVAPKEDALQCNDCHVGNGESRLAGITGVYMPGRDHIPFIDIAGIGIVVLSLLGVIIHGGIGIFTKKEEKDKENDDK